MYEAVQLIAIDQPDTCVPDIIRRDGTVLHLGPSDRLFIDSFCCHTLFYGALSLRVDDFVLFMFGDTEYDSFTPVQRINGEDTMEIPTGKVPVIHIPQRNYLDTFKANGHVICAGRFPWKG